MLRKRIIIFLFLCVSLLFMYACAIAPMPEIPPTIEPIIVDQTQAESINEVVVQPTNTKIPFPTLMPTITNTPAPAMQVCVADDAVNMMKKLVPYSEYQVYYNYYEGDSYLEIWFVDPELNAYAKYEELDESVMLARDHAMILAQKLNFAEACLDDLFNKIIFTVVDSNYNTWFYAEIHTSLLPDEIQTEREQLDLLNTNFEVTYRRWDAPEEIDPPPAGSCNWSTAYGNIIANFPPEEENNAVYYYSTESSRVIVAQWEGTYAEMAADSYLITLEEIVYELPCLYPEPEEIYYYMVDDESNYIGGGSVMILDPKSPDMFWNFPVLLEKK
jgi:hypothetical protein